MNDRLLRLALRGNAAFSTTCATAALVQSAPLANALGIPEPEVLVGLGINLLVFAAFLVWLSLRPVISPANGWGVVAADALWVIGTVPIVAGGSLTSLGDTVAAVVALCVGSLAILQSIGLIRARQVAAAG